MSGTVQLELTSDQAQALLGAVGVASIESQVTPDMEEAAHVISDALGSKRMEFAGRDRPYKNVEKAIAFAEAGRELAGDEVTDHAIKMLRQDR